MVRSCIRALAPLMLLLLGTCAPSMNRIEPVPGYVLLWQVDKLLFIRPGTSEVRPVKTQVSLTNIIDVNGSQDALVVISSRVTTPQLAVHVIDLRSGDLITRIPSNAARGDVDALRRRVAFTAYSSANDGSYDVISSNLATGDLEPVTQGDAGPASCISWNRRTSSLAFDANDVIFEWMGGSRIRRLLDGGCPSWSPDGQRLVLRRGAKAIYVYDGASGKVTELYRRGVTESEFAGPMFWSPDQRFIATTVHAGADGYEKQCLAIDTITKRPTLIHAGFAFCGPWLSYPPP